MHDSGTLLEFQRVLERKRSELIHSWLNSNEIAAERFADALDDSISSTVRELLAVEINRKSTALCDIDDALRRITAGTYGSILPVLPAAARQRSRKAHRCGMNMIIVGA